MSFQAYNPATDTLTPIAENDYKDSLEKVSALPQASADLLNKCYLLTANQGTYSKGNIYQCQSDGSSGYAWILINSSGGSAVDVVEDGNMNAVTSNAVYDKFEILGTASEKDFTRFVSPTDSGLPISSSVFSAITNALRGAYHPSGSKTIAELDSSLLIQANVGNVYKITDSGVTTELFIGGAGQTINVGDNAVVVYDVDNEAFKYDLQTGVVDLSKYQKKELETPIQVVDSEETTVDGALNALNEKKANIFYGTEAEFENLPSVQQEQYEYLANENGEAGAKDVYSTTETKTNKVWIDGKSIYRKVVDLPSAVEIQNLGTAGTAICPWGDIDTLISGICKGSTDSVTQLVLFFKNTTSNTVSVSKVNVGITLNVKTVILEYTKAD